MKIDYNRKREIEYISEIRIKTYLGFVWKENKE